MSLETKLAKVIYVCCLTLFLTSLGCWALLAHQDVALSNGRPAGLAVSDEQFAHNAAQGGMAEVKLGQLAQDRGSSDAVKSLAQRMVAQHSRANDQLKQVAAQSSISLPSDISARDQSTYEKLAKLSGRDFDRAYARDMVNDHVADLAEFQKEANAGRNAEIKDFALQSLPMLREHLNQAREMLKAVSASSARRTSGGRGVRSAR
jgi:putative membrane protein